QQLSRTDRPAREFGRLTVRDRPDGATVEIADRGTGFTAEELRDVLLPFFSTKLTGTGLGLTLCREIVEAHAGGSTWRGGPEEARS
ncbi:MAG: ATP-binding protein, partial [Gaiellaceae bacterium]